MRILCLATLVALSGCSSVPPQQTANLPQLASTSAPPKTAPAASPSTVALAQFEPPAGYKKREENGQVFYCTKVVVLGSRFAKTDCRTQKELEDLELQKASMRGEMDQRKNVCGSAAGCANP